LKRAWLTALGLVDMPYYLLIDNAIARTINISLARAFAFRAWALSLIGYSFCSGSANCDAGSFERPLDVSLAMIVS
jgi:K+-transporting ATPase A subunit